jgi:hypothetical protein
MWWGSDMQMTINDAIYFCFVSGQGAPRKPHGTFDLARSEAQRLSALHPTRNVYVLGAVLKIDGTPLPDEVAPSGRKVLRVPVKNVVDK